MPLNGYRRWLLALLLVILACNLVDRVALGLLLQEIKADLSLSDTQLGLLTGIAFSLFYSSLGIPIARWADRGNRVVIIAVTTALWSIAVALSGFAGNFLQLLTIRVGVAVGEAGCIPPAHSLIADYFTRTERPRAFARYMLGYPLSAVLGFFVASRLNALYGWRMTFVLLGLPGIALAALAWLTIREPRRSAPCAMPSDSAIPPPPGLLEVLRTLWSNRTFRHLLVGYCVASFFGYGVWQWKPAFFIRTYGMDTQEVGAWFALIYGLGGFAGMYCGGELASRYASRDEPRQLAALALTYCVFGVISAGIYLAPTAPVALGLLVLATVGAYAVYGPLFAIIQTLVPPRMRAVALATIYLFANLIGMGLGPLAVGILSDALRPWAGNESLRYALLALCPGYAWCGWHLWRASKTVREDLEAVL